MTSSYTDTLQGRILHRGAVYSAKITYYPVGVDKLYLVAKAFKDLFNFAFISLNVGFICVGVRECAVSRAIIRDMLASGKAWYERCLFLIARDNKKGINIRPNNDFVLKLWYRYMR